MRVNTVETLPKKTNKPIYIDSESYCDIQELKFCPNSHNILRLRIFIYANHIERTQMKNEFELDFGDCRLPISR